jgi:ABC-type proline/glycine betaine transport system substrate-binding protein
MGWTTDYVNFRSGSGAALDAEITSSIRRGKPVLFYYWSPTPLLGRSSWSSWKSRHSMPRPGKP